MIIKGIISAVYEEERKVSVILPEYDNLTTNPLYVYGDVNINSFSVNDFVIVMMFNDVFGDGVVLAKATAGGGGTADSVDWNNVTNKPAGLVVDEKYVHTDSNYTKAEKDKLEKIENGAEVNIIESIKVNGNPINISGKVANIEIEMEADSCSWEEITDKPQDFPPSNHEHNVSDIADLDFFTEEEIENICDFEGDPEGDIIPIATRSTIGCVVIGDGLDINEKGVLSSLGVQMELVWENASPTSTFETQTISLDLSGYDFVDIYTRYSTSDASETVTRIRVGCESDIIRFYYATTANQTMGVRARNKVSVTESGIYFPVCQVRRITDTVVNENDGYIIPTKIIGFKGVR